MAKKDCILVVQMCDNNNIPIWVLNRVFDLGSTLKDPKYFQHFYANSDMLLDKHSALAYAEALHFEHRTAMGIMLFTKYRDLTYDQFIAELTKQTPYGVSRSNANNNNDNQQPPYHSPY